MIPRHLPPTAVPITMRDLWRGLAALGNPAGALDCFQSQLRGRIGDSSCYLLSSGRAALTTILLGLRNLSDRSRVVVPAYSCPTIVQAVLRAGLEPELCDVSPRTLDLDLDALHSVLEGPVGATVLAVIPTYLYGWVQDVRALLSAGRERGFFVVEDAAQAFGASLKGSMVGTRADVGLYSLGRGKCLPAGGGGLIVMGAHCSPAVVQAIEVELGGQPPVRRSWDLRALALLLGYGLATRPWGWWFIVRSPLNPAEDGINVEALPPIRLGTMSPVRAGVASSILERLDQVHATRRTNAERLMELLGGFHFLAFPDIPPGAEPVFLRLPVVVDSPQRANLLFAELDRAGIGVSRSYRRTLPDLYSGWVLSSSRAFPGASRLATCLLTLPTHELLKERDFRSIVAAFRAAGSRARSAP